MITIRHATIEEKRKTYEWLCLSDTACMHMGEPDYPESPIPTWEEFIDDFEDFYYQPESRTKGSVLIIKNNEEEIGCMCYACFHVYDHIAELDIWLKEKRYCGHGLGTEALKKLIEYLHKDLKIMKFIIRPSERNKRAIRAYEKVGFKAQQNKEENIKTYIRTECLEQYGDGDYGLDDTAVLTMEV